MSASHSCGICYGEFPEMSLIRNGCCSLELCRKCMTCLDEISGQNTCPQCRTAFAHKPIVDINGALRIQREIHQASILQYQTQIQNLRDDVKYLKRMRSDDNARYNRDNEMLQNRILQYKRQIRHLQSADDRREDLESAVKRYHLNIYNPDFDFTSRYSV